MTVASSDDVTISTERSKFLLELLDDLRLDRDRVREQAEHFDRYVRELEAWVRTLQDCEKPTQRQERPNHLDEWEFSMNWPQNE